jgi:hypothetical protein
MSEDDKQASGIHGQLMKHLLSERHRYASEKEFKDFAVDEVRRFINDLREYEIELTLRSHYLEGTPSDHED